jgi:hypothetical protein
LNYELNDGIRTRSLFLKKLRGIPIKRSVYFFTLKDRVLRYFDSYDPRDFRINKREKITKETDYSTQLFQTGYQDLDIHIGGTLPRRGLITVEKEDTLSSDIIILFLNDLFYNFSKRRYSLLLDSGLNEVLTDLPKSKNQSYELYVMDELRSTTRSAQDRIKRKNNFYKYVDKAVSGLKNMEKIVAMVESKSLDNFISGTSDITDCCRFIRSKFELSFLILNSNNNLERYYSVSDIHLKFILICGTLFLKCSTPASALFGIKVVNSVPQIQLDHVL